MSYSWSRQQGNAQLSEQHYTTGLDWDWIALHSCYTVKCFWPDGLPYVLCFSFWHWWYTIKYCKIGDVFYTALFTSGFTGCQMSGVFTVSESNIFKFNNCLESILIGQESKHLNHAFDNKKTNCQCNSTDITLPMETESIFQDLKFCEIFCCFESSFSLWHQHMTEHPMMILHQSHFLVNIVLR